MEPRIESTPPELVPKVDLNKFDSRMGSSPWLHFVYGNVTTGDPVVDYWGAKEGVVNEEGEFDTQFLSIMAETTEYLEGHRGEPMMLINTIHQPDGRISTVRAVVGILAEGGSILAGASQAYNQNYGQRGFSNAGKNIHHIEVTSPFDIGLRLDRVVALNSDTISISGEHFVYGLERDRHDDNVRVDEVVAGADIIPWIKSTFGEGREAYEVFRGVLIALAGTGADAAHLQDDTFLRMLTRDRQSLLIARRIAVDHSEALDSIEAMRALVREDTRDRLKRLKSFSGEVAYRLGELGVTTDDAVTSVEGITLKVPRPQANSVPLIDRELMETDPGLIDLSKHQAELK